MRISIIVATGLQRQIGLAGQIPWHLSADLRNFKNLTMGHHLIVGRKTYQSIGRPLPGRKMLIISRNKDFSAPDCQTIGSLTEAIEKARQAGDSEVFIAGGGEIYKESLAVADHLYWTQVFYDGEADTFFPDITNMDWKKTFSEFSPESNGEPAWQYGIWEKGTAN